MSERADFTPFKDKFSYRVLNQDATRGGPSRVHEFDPDDERVVRVYIPFEAGSRSEHRPISVEAAQERIRRTEACFKVLEKFVKVVPHSFVIGENEFSPDGSPTIYTVAERIHGRALDKEIKAPKLIDAEDSRLTNQEIQEFLSNLVSYYREAFFENENYLSDLDTSGFMYGTTSSDPNRKIYLVDLDLFSGESNPNLGKGDYDPRGAAFGTMRYMLNEAEEFRDLKLPELRQEVNRLQEQVMHTS